MAIISFVRKTVGIYHSRTNKFSYTTINLQSRNPHDIRPEEAQELAALIHTLNFEYEVDVATRPEQVGKGVTLNKVLYIWLPRTLIAGGAIAATQIIQEVAKMAVKWARDRLKKKGTSRRPTYIAIYGPDGKVLKSVVVKDATQEVEDRTKADRKLKIKHKPPLLGE